MPRNTPRSVRRLEMTEEELLALPVSFDVVTAGRALGIGRTKAYELAKRGEFPCPVLPIGCRYQVTKAELFRVLGLQLPSENAA